MLFSRQNQLGQSLVELLIAVGVFAVFAVGVAGLAFDGFISSYESDERTQALFLVQEGIDAAHSIRDQSWKLLTNGNHGLDNSNGYWEFSGASETIDGVYTRTIIVADGQRDGGGELVLSGGTADPRVKLIRSEVSYDPTYGPAQTVAVEKYLTDWAVYDWLETTNGEFNGGTFSDTEVIGSGVNANVELVDSGGGPVAGPPEWVFGGGPFFIDTKDSEFGAGTFNDTALSGTGNDGLVQLAQTPGWIEFAFPFGDLDMTNTDGTWAVGEGGRIFEYTGSIWVQVDSPSNANLFSVSTVSSSEAYIVGSNGTTMRFDGADWYQLSSPTSRDLNSVSLVSSSFGVAVGNEGTIIHWNGAAWNSVSSPTSRDLHSVFALSPTDAWAVGKNGEIVHWNGTSWVTVSSPVNQSLESIWMNSATDGHAVGLGGTTLRWDGVSWTESYSPPPSEPVYGVSMISPTDGFAVGQAGRIMRWNGSEWSDSITPTGQELSSVSMLSATDGWIVGKNGNLLHWNGSTWAPFEQASSRVYNAVDLLDANNGIGVGNNGEIIEWKGDAWRSVTSNSNETLYGVDILNTSDIWVVGNKKEILHYDGISWGAVSPPGGQNIAYRDVSMISASDGFISADNGKIIRWNGSSWSDFTSPSSNDLFSIEMLSSTDGYIVGQSGEALKWNGSAWSSVSTPTGNNLYGLDMVSGIFGVAVGANGTILHWDGATWNTVTSPTTQDLQSVHLTSTTNGYAVGAGGQILVWDGMNWSLVTSPTITNLNAISITSPTNGWALGNNGLIIRLGAFYNASGTFESRIFNSSSGSTIWDVLSWKEKNYSPTDLTIATRTGNTATPDGTWSGWSTEETNAFSSSITSPSAQYIQYRATLSTSNPQVTPELKQILLFYDGPGIGGDVNGVSMLSSTNGWAVGDSGGIIRYDGLTWSTVTSPVGSDLFEVDMISATNGWAVGFSGAMISWDGVSWSDQSGITSETLNDVDFASSTNGWAVGANGTILQWNGTTWSLPASPTASNLHAVYALSSSEAYAVGDAGVTLKWDGVSWATMVNPIGVTLYDVFFLSSTEGWAVGDSGKITFYNGTSWTEQTDAGVISLQGVWVNASDAAWAVGSNGRILTWDGVAWTIESLPTTEQFQDLEMTSSADGWAVGLNGTFAHYTPTTTGGGGGGGSTPIQFIDTNQTDFDAGVYSTTEWDTDHVQLTASSTSGTFTSQIFDATDVNTQWDDISWTENFPGGSGLIMEAGSVTASSSYTTVNLQETYTSPVVIPFYFESNNTEPVSPRLDNITASSFDIALTSPGGGSNGSSTETSDTDFNAGTYTTTEVTGSGAGASIILTSTTGWSAHADSQGATTENINDIDSLASNNIWAVGANGKILQYNGTNWSEHSDIGTNELFSVEAIASNDIWATGPSGKFYHYNGTSWSETHDVSNRAVYDIDAISASDIWAVGDHGDVDYYNGSTWVKFDDMGNQAIHAVTAIATNDVWAAGASGKFYRYNGTTWSEFVDLGGETIYGIDAVSSTDIWATATNGIVYHYNGTTWSQHSDLGADTINSIQALSANDIWATGANGKVYHYDGATWSEFTDLGAQIFDAVHFISASEGWIAGDGGVIYQYASSYSASGTFESQVLDSGTAGASWGTIAWVEDLSAFGTDITIDTRTGETAIPDGSWSAFAGGYSTSGGQAITSPAGRYIQYRVNFTTSDTSGTPQFDEVTLNWSVGGPSIASDTVYYLVVEEGAWTMPDGTLIEAATFDTSTIGYKGSWNADNQNFSHTYGTAPIVFGAIQSNNDSSWITTWLSRQGSRTNPPNTTGFQMGLNGAEAVTSHGAVETLGWVAIEQGTGIIETTNFEVQITSDSVAGHNNGCNTFTFLNSYSSNPLAIGSQLEMDGNDGGWGVGCSLSTSQIGMHSEEDTITDAERSHTGETFGFVAFENAFSYNALSSIDLTIQVRSCDDAACSGEIFIGPDGTIGTVYTTSSGQSLNVIDNRYFQYQVTFTDGSGASSPELSEVVIDGTIPSGGGGSGYPSSGTFLSSIHNSDSTLTEWDTLYWSEALPAFTDLTIAVRVGNTAVPDGSWTSWSTEYSDPNGTELNLTGQYAQYRLTLYSSDVTATPSAEDITITYNP